MLKYQSDYNISSSAASVDKTVKAAQKIGATHLALTDSKTVAGTMPFLSACEKANIKPIIGIQSGGFLLYAKNNNGYKSLCRTANGTPRIEDTIAVSGFLHSDLYNVAFQPHNLIHIYSRQDAENCLKENYEDLLREQLLNYQNTFGEDFYVGVHHLYEKHLPTVNLFNEIICKLAKSLDIPILSLSDIYYVEKEDAVIHRILLANKHKCELLDIDEKLSPEEQQFGICSVAYVQDMLPFTNKTEQANLDAFLDKIEGYQLKSFPKMKQFCEDDFAEFDKLLEAGKAKIEDWNDTYQSRLDEEVALMKSFQILVTYFLVVADYCRWAKQQGMRIGERGSAAGCLITYLLDIINLNPLKYGLLFSRFFNEGRIKKDGVAIPDIDVDFPKLRRQEVQDYVLRKYGMDHAAYMRTFGRFKGREAIKTIFRVYGSVNAAQANEISKLILQNDKISDKLQTMKQERGQQSAIIYSLENVPDLWQYCTVEYNTDTGEYTFDGDRAFDFEKAIRLEGIIKQKGQHASGIILSADPLRDICDVEKEKDRYVANMEMQDIESMGAVKLDILGNVSLDKIMKAEELIRGI